MNIRAFFTAQPPASHWSFRYGMLLVCLLLVAWNVQWHLNLPRDYPYDRYSGTVVVLMLLFNHLAYQFRWPASVTLVLRLFAWVWLVFGCVYIFYGMHVLYP
jgi:hypothetical protein